MARRANLVPINEDVTLIDDAGESTCYLVTGEKCALLIDTLNGKENLMDVVREITKLPVIVVNTHGHCDHIYGNVFFEEAYLHPKDWELHDLHFGFPEIQEIMKKSGLKPCRLLPLKEDDVFDLGGLTLEVIPVPGHTQGSVALLCRKHRLLFSGDAVNTHLWMQLSESTPLKVLSESLNHLLDGYRSAFDFILTGHSKGPEDAAQVEELAEGVIDLMHGECDKDRDYPWFRGVDKAHPFGREGQHVIVYNQVNVQIERGVRKPYPPIRHISNNPGLAGMAYVKPGIVYSTQTGQDITLALITPWKPEGILTPKSPLIVFVQGSGWIFPDIHYELAQMANYAQQGIAVAMVTHRNSLEGHPFPAYLQDVKTAIRYLRQNAEEYHIDKERMGIFGTSSGGNTALLVGLTGDDPRYKTAEYAQESDAVKLVIECFGPTDLMGLLGGELPGEPHGNVFRALTSGKDVKQVFVEMSPVSHVEDGKDYPPFLLIHGSADTLVPYDQMELMYRRLCDCGADTRAICVDHAPHEGSFWSRELHGIILDYIQEKL